MSSEEFFAHPSPQVANCLMLDAASCAHALDVQKRVTLECPSTVIIFMADCIEVGTAVKAIKAGAAEFFTKPCPEESLLTSIREALERSQLSLTYETEIRTLRERYSALTRREREVMTLVVSGLLNKQIGGELGISEITVKAHRGQTMQKMQAYSLAHLVRMAATLGVVAVPKAVIRERRMETTNGEDARTASRNCGLPLSKNKKSHPDAGECLAHSEQTVACLSGDYAGNRRYSVSPKKLAHSTITIWWETRKGI